MNAAPRKPKFAFLDESETNLDELIADPYPVNNNFPLLPPRFEPLTDRPVLSDGTPPTALGEAVMDWWGVTHERPPSECPPGLVRAVEAVSGGLPGNIGRIRSSFGPGGPRWRRNHAGQYAAAVELDAWIPMIGMATVQPRGNTSYAAKLRGMTSGNPLPIIHEIGEGLTVRGQSADHFRLIRKAQRRALKPDGYTGTRRDFVDSLALEGIKEEIRAVSFHLIANGGAQSGWHIETTDGWTRVAVAQAVMSQLLGGLPTDLSRLHWENGDDTYTVRDWTADDVSLAYDRMRFDEAGFDVWPTERAPRVIDAWANNASPAAKAVIRLMSCRLTLTIHAQPARGHTTQNVIYADMARFHVKEHQPAPWTAGDADAFTGRMIVSDLLAEKYLTEDERDVMLGATVVPWRDDPDRHPYRNRLVAAVDTMVKAVVEDPDDRGRYPTVRDTLKAAQVVNSPTKAATAAAALVVSIADVADLGEAGGFAAMLRRSFANKALRRLKQHEGDWTSHVTKDLNRIAEAAAAEVDQVLGTASHRDFMGANMRALAILGMVAHGMNPALMQYRKVIGTDEEGEPITQRWPSSMTASGRGNRTNVKGGGAEAYAIVFNMVRSPRGQAQLVEIIRAVTDHDEPVIPRDPENSELELLEDELRILWANTPGRDGQPRRADEDRDPSFSQDDDDDRLTPDGRRGLWEEDQWDEVVGALRADLRGLASWVSNLRLVPAGPDLLNLSEDEWDPEDEDLPRMLQTVGIDESDGAGMDDDLHQLRTFFTEGVLARLRGNR